MTSALIRVAIIVAVAVLLVPGVASPQLAEALVETNKTTRVSFETRVRSEEFEKPAIGRRDQDLAPGTSAMSGDHGRAAGAMVTW